MKPSGVNRKWRRMGRLKVSKIPKSHTDFHLAHARRDGKLKRALDRDENEGEAKRKYNPNKAKPNLTAPIDPNRANVSTEEAFQQPHRN